MLAFGNDISTSFFKSGNEFMEAFVYKWFTLFYFGLGSIFFVQGSVGLIKSVTLTELLSKQLTDEKPPSLILRWLRYYILFGLTSVILAIWAISFIPMLYSISLLLASFTIGRWLVHWKALFPVITEPRALRTIILRLSSFLWISGILSLFLGYFHIKGGM